MPRRVVANPTLRCVRCLLEPRWCVCDGLRAVETPLAVDVLMHEREMHRPSSTGHLIGRVVAGSRIHECVDGLPPAAETVARPGRELWVLHPAGEIPPSGDCKPDDIQIVLLDGSWSEAGRMRKSVSGWGRCVRLPMAVRGRYPLRTQKDAGELSTAEALIFVYDMLGMTAARDALRVQLELHVFASLKMRGKPAEAAAYLKNSLVAQALPDVIAAMEPQTGDKRIEARLRYDERRARAQPFHTTTTTGQAMPEGSALSRKQSG